MKYRVIATNSDLYPFTVQRKNEKSFLPFWRKITKCRSYHEASRFVREAAERHSKHPVGSIALEYDETDLVVERLKNQSMADGRVEGQMNVTSAAPMMPASAIAKSAMLKQEGRY
jgi:hypothetical protein